MNASDIEKIVLAQAVVTIFAMIVTYVKLRQDFRQYARQQLFSVRLDRLRRQLSEFYGPMHMLSVANERIAKVAWGTDIWHRVWRETLIPSELKIEEILLSKIELLDDDALPDSFLAFVTHARLARSYLETGQGLEYFEKGVHYPRQFNKDSPMRTRGPGLVTTRRSRVRSKTRPNFTAADERLGRTNGSCDR